MKLSRIKFLMIMLCVSILTIAGCSGGGGDNSSGTGSPSQIESVEIGKNRIYPYVSESESQELIAGNTEFGVRLYHAISEKNNENLFFSPYSISLAFAMLYAGAQDETEAQIAETLCFYLSQDRLHPAFNQLDQMIASRGDKTVSTLNIANTMWGQKGYSFLSSYLDILDENYNMRINLIDFFNDPEGSRMAINEWVRNETEIRNVLPKGSLSSSTRFILTNTIYLKALWKFQFDKNETRNEFFYPISEPRKSVPMMTQKGSFNYTEGDGYQAVELPYYLKTGSILSAEEKCQEEELSMVILLPEADQFTEFEEGLSADQLDRISENLKEESSFCKIVRLTLPRFRYESDSVSLRGILTKMGMPVVFTSDADFSGIDGTRNLFIGDMIHNTFISVDEDGTKAGGVTIIVPPVSPDEPAVMTINRPFIFFIRDIKTEAILFLGRVMNPA